MATSANYIMNHDILLFDELILFVTNFINKAHFNETFGEDHFRDYLVLMHENILN